ncbi:MAG: PD-(D/E)XK nuclease family protein [Pseudomonadota bacterium]
MPIYSHSRLSRFENCKLSYKYCYIDRIRKEEQGVEAFLGSRFHEVMEKLYAELKFKTATLDELKAYFNELWDKNWNEGVLIVRKDRQPDDYRKIGLKAIEDYYGRYHPFEEGRLLGIEKRIVIDLDGTDKYKVQGFIDRLMEREDGHYEIHDYKTSNTLPEQRYLDKDRQLALYEMGVRAAWPDAKEVDLVWHYVTFDKEMRSRRTTDQLEDIKKNTIGLIDTIEATEEFPPTESNLCRWCDYQDICPLFSHKFKTDPLPVNEYLKEDGVVLVNAYADIDLKKKDLNAQIAELDTEQKKIKEAVVVLSEKEGVDRLYGSNNMLTVKEEIKVNYPKSGDENRPDFVRQMHDMGLWDTVTDVQWSVLKKIAKAKDWAKDVPSELKEFISVDRYKKLTLSKKKDEE